jgi:hypothetical protein
MTSVPTVDEVGHPFVITTVVVVTSLRSLELYRYVVRCAVIFNLGKISIWVIFEVINKVTCICIFAPKRHHLIICFQFQN